MASQALTILRDQLHRKEQQAVAEFTQARQQLLSFEHQLTQLETYRRSYMEQSLARGADGILASGFHQYQAFIQTIEKAESDQQQSVGRLRTNVQQKRQQWLELQTRRKAIEQLQQRQLQKVAHKMARDEQKLLDEYATLRFARQHNPL
ncbi:flagellar export protein FliJ [Celerinatantimonas yamalensis]|uniref:Flagellar FliJ protein n=1 Tax=Celerinatantimonas yamalensis TaxID=559956 RepID=A0ABW9G615_9GAMM